MLAKKDDEGQTVVTKRTLGNSALDPVMIRKLTGGADPKNKLSPFMTVNDIVAKTACTYERNALGAIKLSIRKTIASLVCRYWWLLAVIIGWFMLLRTFREYTNSIVSTGRIFVGPQ